MFSSYGFSINVNKAENGYVVNFNYAVENPEATAAPQSWTSKTYIANDFSAVESLIKQHSKAA